MKKRPLLLILCGLFCLCSCNENPTNNDDNIVGEYDDNSDFGKDSVKLSFKSASSYDYLKTLKDKEISINGYMATSSPVDGSFIFLMNMPYQSCPFCKPNTSQLSNTIEVYPKEKEKFSYTSSAIKIVGTLKVAEDVNVPFTDPFDYEFVFKIVDAEYRILKDSDLTGEFALWQKFAKTTLITDIYKMFDYLDFVCNWPDYFINSYENSKGEQVPGFYLYPADALKFLETDGASYNYGYKDGYFDKFIQRINKISTTGFEKLITIINNAKQLANYALEQLTTEQYTSEYKYVDKFGNSDYVFKLNDTTLKAQADNIYYSFSDWLSSFEM